MLKRLSFEELARGEDQAPSASAPPMISISSVVIAAWRARLYCSVSFAIMSRAFFVAESIAVMRDQLGRRGLIEGPKHGDLDVHGHEHREQRALVRLEDVVDGRRGGLRFACFARDHASRRAERAARPPRSASSRS